MKPLDLLAGGKEQEIFISLSKNAVFECAYYIFHMDRFRLML